MPSSWWARRRLSMAWRDMPPSARPACSAESRPPALAASRSRCAAPLAHASASGSSGRATVKAAGSPSARATAPKSVGAVKASVIASMLAERAMCSMACSALRRNAFLTISADSRPGVGRERLAVLTCRSALGIMGSVAHGVRWGVRMLRQPACVTGKDGAQPQGRCDGYSAHAGWGSGLVGRQARTAADPELTIHEQKDDRREGLSSQKVGANEEYDGDADAET